MCLPGVKLVVRNRLSDQKLEWSALDLWAIGVGLIGPLAFLSTLFLGTSILLTLALNAPEVAPILLVPAMLTRRGKPKNPWLGPLLVLNLLIFGLFFWMVLYD